jgi:two-component system LytT family response regulator
VTAAAIRTMIVDDEPLARLRLRTLLAEHADFAVVAECADGREALEAIGRVRPELVFLDVQMAEVDGVAVAQGLERMSAAGPAPTVVFVTAFDQYAVRAFELRALDYLLKPFDESRFAATLRRVREQRASAETKDAHGRLLGLLRELGRGEAIPAAGGTQSTQGAPARAASVLRVADLDVDDLGSPKLSNR